LHSIELLKDWAIVSKNSSLAGQFLFTDKRLRVTGGVAQFLRFP
jgi:hypothetical protein